MDENILTAEDAEKGKFQITNHKPQINFNDSISNIGTLVFGVYLVFDA
jgi:hypothetical protein